MMAYGKTKGALAALVALLVVAAMAFATVVGATAASGPRALADEPLTPQPFDPGESGVPVERAYLAWYDSAANEYVEVDDAHAVIAEGRAHFDVMLEYADGTVKSAAEEGDEVSWELENATWGGEELVDIVKTGDNAGTVTLIGGSSKVVLVRATCEGREGENPVAAVNLVGSTAAPASGVAIDAVDFACTADGASWWGPSSKGLVDLPVVNASSGSATVIATVSYTSSNDSYYGRFPGLDNESANLFWGASAFFDERGARTDALLATTTSKNEGATLTATGAGNGWAVLRCDSLAYPDFGGQELPVRIQGAPEEQAAPARLTLSGAQLLYRDENGLFREYSGYNLTTSPTAIDEPFGNVAFDVRLEFADGSTARASERGIAVDWVARGLVSGGVPIATFTADGVLRATHAGNGRANIASAAVNGTKANGTRAYVRITNNDAGFAPIGDQLSISARSNYWIPDDANSGPANSDDWYWRSTPNTGTSRQTQPLVVGSSTAKTSTCALRAGIRWNDGTVTYDADADGANRMWSVLGCWDTNLVTCDALVSVNDDGEVTSTEVGTGYASILCMANVPVYDEQGNKTTKLMMATYVVAVYQPTSDVKRMVLLDQAGDELKTSSLVLPNGDGLYHFYVRITFRDGTTASSFPSAGDYDSTATSGVEWQVFRNENQREEERYSSVRAGDFHAETGFSRGYVRACLKGASFSGGDVTCGVTVIAEDTVETTGQTDAMTVKIYHYSDYKNHGADAPVAKQVEVTRAQLEQFATYSTWYTFLRRNGVSFATVYARGVAMENLLALCGVDSDRLVSMLFQGADGYAPERHSADFILGTQYRYTNYYYHAELPGLMQQQSVAPMLALSYYMKNNGGYEDATDRDNAGMAGFNYLSSDSTMRVIFGMTAPETPNARLSVVKVSEIAIVVDDNTFQPEQPDEEDEPQQPDEEDEPEDPKDEEKPEVVIPEEVEPKDPDEPDDPKDPEDPDEPVVIVPDDEIEPEPEPEPQPEEEPEEEPDPEDEPVPVVVVEQEPEPEPEPEPEEEEEPEPEPEQEPDPVPVLPANPHDQQRPDDDSGTTTPSGEEGDPGDGDQGGTNPYQGGKRDAGVGTDRKRGQQVALVPDGAGEPVEVGFEDGTNDVNDSEGAEHGFDVEQGSEGNVETAGEMLLREMSATPREDVRMIVPPADINGLYWAATGTSLGLMLLLGGLLPYLRYRRDSLDGKRLAAGGESR